MSITRRDFVRKTALASLLVSAPRLTEGADRTTSSQGGMTIDRQSWVRRHNPLVDHFDPFSALSVGNGEFAFTVDVTGLQTFYGECLQRFPLCTASHWGWHTLPAPPGVDPSAFRFQEFSAHGRPVGYATDPSGQEVLFHWLRQNPHRLHLGRIGLKLVRADGAPAQSKDLHQVRQQLDLWTGMIESRFELDGVPIQLWTCCHPELDQVAVRIESQLLETGKLQVLFDFPYGSHEVSMADWNAPDRHVTKLRQLDEQSVRFERTVDQDRYVGTVSWLGPARLEAAGHHEYLLRASKNHLELVCCFSPEVSTEKLPEFSKTRDASAAKWSDFWTHGGAVDLSDSTDSRANELERRIVLSLYQTAIHCAGSLPSAETGLLFNSWYGKFHLEMHWWHSVHFAAWGRFHLFERSLGIYRQILPGARDIARRQGYSGARWPKMIGPDGNDAPSPVGPLLIWQQPHPIYYAELCFRQRPLRETLETWREIVFDTAEFMASFAVFDRKKGCFVLGPPLKTVSENTDPRTTVNPTFELAYWRFGLRVAQAWRERLGLGRNARWDNVLSHLSPLPTQDGIYLMQEGMADTFTKFNWEHPALVGALGVQPGDGVEPETMRRTVRKVMEVWEWKRTWGWDFPMMAMAAARVSEPELAVRSLLMDNPKNRFLPNGHVYQRENLTAYLPGNGGLLSAIALMAAGWTDGPQEKAPGFPSNGWQVRCEGLHRWL